MAGCRKNGISTDHMAPEIGAKLGLTAAMVRAVHKMTAKMTCEAIIDGKEVVFIGLGSLYSVNWRYFVDGVRYPVKRAMFKANVPMKAALRIVNAPKRHEIFGPARRRAVEADLAGQKKDAPSGASEDVSDGDG